ncbi:hypothetical protein OV203_04980 [Nannocystis sp. ILAH1]|uniref:hypothetical protein n=1 Tax=unclassified Nannocystis TaxID=2627009 RepID=UPI00226FE462|nr:MULTISPECIES: hypothetical protein [unclassified Nannocystis]MCY0986459.1 hypothetical protein [Nannocystis sp. ILAH1]MCY1071334.1 hypothetical protein [Nannocystis sp. RBIL2]
MAPRRTPPSCCDAELVAKRALAEQVEDIMALAQFEAAAGLVRAVRRSGQDRFGVGTQGGTRALHDSSLGRRFACPTL